MILEREDEGQKEKKKVILTSMPNTTVERCFKNILHIYIFYANSMIKFLILKLQKRAYKII